MSTKLSATLEQPIGQEIAKHRQAKLQQNSQNNDVRLLFSIVLSDSSHDVLIAKDRSDVSKVFHNVNANFSKTYRMTYGYSNKQNIFSSSPYYSSISSSWMLLYIGKLLFDKVASQREKGFEIPYSCFDDFELNYLPTAFDGTFLRNMFQMNIIELVDFYENCSREQIYDYAYNNIRSLDKGDYINIRFKGK